MAAKQPMPGRSAEREQHSRAFWPLVDFEVAVDVPAAGANASWYWCAGVSPQQVARACWELLLFAASTSQTARRGGGRDGMFCPSETRGEKQAVAQFALY